MKNVVRTVGKNRPGQGVVLQEVVRGSITEKVAFEQKLKVWDASWRYTSPMGPFTFEKLKNSQQMELRESLLFEEIAVSSLKESETCLGP